MSRLPRVYMAGKIGHTDWRHTLVPRGRSENGLRHVELHYDRERDWIDINERFQRPLMVDGFEYCGPYFLGDDHGCFHGPTQHGLIDPGYADGPGQADEDFPQQIERRTVMRSCLHWINQADVIFCWLEGLDAYGTLVELGYARALGIPIYVATDGEIQRQHDLQIAEHNRTAKPHDMLPISAVGADPWLELWFAREISASFEREWSIGGAWEGFRQWWGRQGWSPDRPRRRVWVMETVGHELFRGS